MKEETCLVLDFLPNGYADRRKSEPIAQAIGTSFFSLLELVPREGINLITEEEVYIGEGKRDKIRFIRGQLDYQNLTNMGKTIMPEIIEKLVRRNEKRFVEFFNKAATITPRMHQFQLLPGVGKKHLSDILDERRKKPFENFEELRQRVKLFPDPVKTLVARIILELEGEEKYYLFTPRPRKAVMPY
jgi:putative nucleotide binding protein